MGVPASEALDMGPSGDLDPCILSSGRVPQVINAALGESFAPSQQQSPWPQRVLPRPPCRPVNPTRGGSRFLYMDEVRTAPVIDGVRSTMARCHVASSCEPITSSIAGTPWWCRIATERIAIVRGVLCWQMCALVAGVALVSDSPQRRLAAETLVTRHRLDNGLRIVVSEDRSSPFIAVALAYRAGSMYEPKGRAGMAHLVEHLMFKGSENVKPGDHMRLIDLHGGTVGAYTTKDLTLFEDTVPPTEIDVALRLEADRMRSLKLSQRDVDLERAAVIQESEGKRPYGTRNVLFAPLFYRTSAYAADPGGIAGIPRVTVEDVAAFHQAYYGPNSAALGLVGNITPDAAIRLVAAAFSSITPRARPVEPSVAAVPQTSERRQRHTDPTGRGPLIQRGFHVPERMTPDHDAMLVAGSLLRARLKQALTNEQQIASSVVVFLDDVRGPGALIIQLFGNPDARADQLERALDRELTRSIDQPVTPEDTARASKALRRQLIEDDGLRRRPATLARYELLYSQPMLIELLPERLKSVTAERVHRALQTYITPANRATLTLEPGSSKTESLLGGRP